MLDDLEERIRRLETAMRAAEDEGWPDASRLPQPLPWADQAEPETSCPQKPAIGGRPTTTDGAN